MILGRVVLDKTASGISALMTIRSLIKSIATG